MAHPRTNPYPYLPASANPYVSASTNPYLPASSNPYLPASTNPYGPGSKHQILENFLREDVSGDVGPKPFHQTHLGRLPTELRQMIFTELLATPPAFAGHDFVTTSSDVRASSTAPIRFVHIKASWRQVMWTCRQIYYEAHPIFFASKAYFFAKPPARLFEFSMISFRQVLRLDTITALCLSGFVETVPLYSKERLDEIFSDPNDLRSKFNTRQQLEMQTFKTIWSQSTFCLQGLKSLRTVSLCFLVGEELLYVNLLYGISDMRRGFVEFIDANRWVIREQNPEDSWSIQYSCFTNGDFNKGKDNEEISYDRRRIEYDVTDIDSRAPGLQEGDERFVEVSIRWPVAKSPAQDPLDTDQDDRSSVDPHNDSNVVSSNQETHESQLGARFPADTTEESDIEPLTPDSHEIQREVSPDQAEENVLTENSENDDVFAEVEPNSNVNDESPLLGRNGEDSGDPQEIMATQQERDHSLLQSSSEEVSGAQSGAQYSPQAETLSLSHTLERLARYGPVTTGDDQSSPLDTSDRHDQIQNATDTKTSTAHAESPKHTENFHSEHSAETDQVQQNSNVNVGEPSHHTNGPVLSRGRIQPLPEISDAPNPYTEEEMESYERWQQGSISGSQEQNDKALHKEREASPSHEKKIERLVKTSVTGSTAETPAKQSSTTSSQEMPLLLAITSLLLLLILAILAYLP